MTKRPLIQFDTACVHAGSDAQPRHPGVNSPVYPSTAYDYRAGEVIYPRYYNTPNQRVLEKKTSTLEHAEASVLFSSGLAAISAALFAFLRPGDHALFSGQLYGGTIALLRKEFERQGITYTFADFGSPGQLENQLRPSTRLLYFETPTNPTLCIYDIAALARFAKGNGLLTLIDNTFASPVNQRPLCLGADIAIHSGTKYLGGHSDLSFGTASGTKENIAAIRETAKLFGGNLNALDAYLIERSLKTLSIRVERQNANAMALARFLDMHPAVQHVNYPGLGTHPQHSLAQKQMDSFGGMLSFTLRHDTKQAADNVLQKLELIQPAVSLGGVESLISSPADTSHAALTPTERRAAGIPDSMLRVSAGIEAAEDLQADLGQALNDLNTND